MQFSFAQEKTVTGVVSDKTGPLPGANVVVKGTTRSAQADFDGKYSIKAEKGEVLVFSFTGYINSNVTVGVANSYNVTLVETSVKLDEVVVEGYRNTTKKSTVVAQTTITAKTIENRPNASFIQTLQGQVPGLSISSGSGQPGSKSTVYIRGVSSYSGDTDPLYVIDGVPTYSDNFRSLNPNDIESTTVLKDAAATAIYGNRGTNGVIIVKTRRGGNEDGKTRFRYSTTSSYTKLQTGQYRQADSRQLLRIERNFQVGRGNSNPVTGAPFTDAEIAAYNINTNWNDIFFRTGVATEHQFAFESQGKNLSAYTSLNYLDQEGILIGTGLKRFSLRNNIDGKSKDEKFRYSSSLALAFSKSAQGGSIGTGAVNRNYVLGAYEGVPYISPSEYTGSQALLDLYSSDGTLLYTPLFLLDKYKTYTNNTDEMRITGSLEASYQITKDFSVLSRTGTEILQSRLLQSEHPISFNAFLFLEPGQEYGGFEDTNNTRTFSFSQLWQATYNKTIAEKHTFGVTGNIEFNFDQLDSSAARQSGLDPRTFVPGAGSGYLTDIAAHDYYGIQGSTGRLKRSLISYFGIFDYDYNKKYGMSLTVRRDGTSRFQEDYRWGNFWSIAARWNLDSEDFIKNLNLFQVLKFRASYGLAGNQFVYAGSPYLGLNPPVFADTYTTVSGLYNNQTGLSFTPGVIDMQWETGKQTDFGLDFELFKNRLRGNLDWYRKVQTKMLNSDRTDPITGYTSIVKNSDIELENQGVELSLAYDLIRNENLKLTIRGNGAYNYDEVSNIKDGFLTNGSNYITQNGSRLFEYNVYEYAGVNPVNGNLLFFQDGALTETPNKKASTHKTSNPLYQGSFGLDFDYKGFFLTTNFTYVQKVWRFDFDMDGLYDPGSIGQFAVTSD
jgi:TonB-linked SusC/RagA family outer membrane protein